MPNDGRINFQVNMDVKKNGLKDLIEPLKQVQSKMNSISSNGNLDEPFKEAASAAKQLESIINSSWNDKLNQLNLNQFNQSIKTSFKDVESLKNILTQAGPEGQAAFNQVASAVLNTNVQLRESNKLLDSMATSMANTVKWGITSSIFNNITSSIQHAYYYAKDLDSSLNDIRIVTGDSADQMQRFARTANDAAKDLGRSTLDYTKAALSFYQQGLSDDEVKARTEVSLKAQNITGAGSQIYDQLTAVWNGFKVATEDTESVVDKLAAVADNSASNMSQLATAMSKVAATANVMGVNVDQLTAQISTVVAATRLAPESVGTAFKTIYSRLNDIKTGADDAQVSLGNYSGKMAELGFNVLDSAGNLRDTGQVIEQIGGRWQTLTRQQQVYLAQTMGGQRQITQVMALFDNWDKYLNNLNVSMSSQGTLMEKNNTYLESTQAHLQQLGAQAEKTYDILFDTDTVNGFIKVLDGSLKSFNNFINSLGGGAKVFTYFGSVAVGVFSKQIAESILKAKNNLDLLINTRNIEKFKANLAKATTTELAQEKNINQKDNAVEYAALKQRAEVQAKLYTESLNARKGLNQQQQIELTNLQKRIGQLTEEKHLLENIDKLKDQYGRADLIGLDSRQLDNQAKVQEKKVQQLTEGLRLIQEQKVIEDQIENNDQERVQELEKIQNLLNKNTEIQKLIQSEEYKKLNTEEQTQWLISKITDQYGIEKKELEQILHIKQLQLQAEGKTKEQIDAEIATLLRGVDTLNNKGNKINFTQNLVKGLSIAGQSLTALTGVMKTFKDETASTTDKFNAGFTGVTSTITAVGTAFGPVGMGVATLANGVLTFLKDATPLGEKLIDYFSTTTEKVEKINEKIKNSNEIESGEKKKISELENIVDEYNELSESVGNYGRNLQNLTQEEQDRYHELTNKFAEYNDSVILGYDNQGNAIVKNQQALKDTIKLLKEEARLQAETNFGTQSEIEGFIDTKNEQFDLPGKQYKKAQKQYENQKNKYKTGHEANFNIKDVLGQITSDDAYKQLNYENNQIKTIFDFFNSSDYKIASENLQSLYGFSDDLIEYLQNITFGQGPNNINELIEILSQLALSESNLFSTQDFNNFINALKNYYVNSDLQMMSVFNKNTLGEAFDNILQAAQKDIKNYEDWQTDLQKYQGELELARQNLNEEAAFDSNFIAKVLTSGTGFDDQFYKLQQSELYNQNIYDAFIDYISGFIYDPNAKNGIDLEAKTASSYQSIIAAGQQYAQNLYQVLLTYGENIQDAEQSAAADIEAILTDEDQSLGSVNEKIISSIQNIINGDLKQSLGDEKSSQYILDLIKQIYNLDDLQLQLDKDGNYTIKAITTSLDKTTNDLKDVIGKRVQGLDLSDLTLSGYTDQQIKQATAAIRTDKDLAFDTLEGWQSWLNNFFTKTKKTADDNDIIENFDRIISAIQKLQSGKNLKLKQQDWLKQTLHITDKELNGLNSNVDWLELITKRILNLTDLDQRKAGMDAIFTDLNTYNKAVQKGYFDKGKGIIPSNVPQKNIGQSQDQIYAHTVALQAQQEAIQMNDEALLEYGKLIGEVDQSITKLDKTQKEAIITYYNNQQALKSLSSQAKALADAEKISNEDLAKFTTELNEQFNTNFSAEWVKQHIDGIASALAIGIDSSKLEQYAENYVPPIASKFSEEFDKVTSIINTIQNSENLSHADKEWLKQALGITDQELQQLDTNEKLLQEIAEKILTIADPDKRANAFGLIYKDLNSYYDDVANGVFNKGKGLIPSNIPQGNIGGGLLNQGNQEAHQAALENSMAAYNVDPTFLQAYGESIHKAYLSTQQLFNLWKQQADGDTLKSLSENLAKNKDQLEANDRQVIEFQQQLKNLAGIDVSTDYIVANIEAISKAFKDGLISGQELEQFIGNFKPETEQGLNAYQKQRDLTKNAAGAKSALQSGSTLSDDQATALAQLESSNTQLAALGQSQGRNSEAYLNLLQQILNTENAITEEKKEQALKDSEALQKKLEEQKLELQQKYDKEYDYLTTAERQELLKQIADINQQITAQQAKQIQLSQADVEQYKDKYHTLQQLQEGLASEEITQDQYTALRPDVLQDQIKTLGKSKEEFEDFVDVLQKSYKGLKGNEKAAEDMAIRQWEIQEALEDLNKNFDDYAQKINNAKSLTKDAKLADQDYATSISALRTAMQDLLGVDLSNEFLEDARNLELIRTAIKGGEGAEQALFDLRAAAANDVIINLGLKPGALEQVSALVNDFILNTDFGTFEIGADLNDTDFLQKLDGLIYQGKLTAEQANAILNSIGYEAEIGSEGQQTTISVPVVRYSSYADTILSNQGGNNSIPSSVFKSVQEAKIDAETQTVTFDVPFIKSTKYTGHKGASNYHNSHPTTPKSSGGGGGGGGGRTPKSGGGSTKAKEPKTMDAVKGKSDRYHDINIDLKHINDQLQKLQQNEKKLANKDLIKNLEAQLKVLNKQRDAYQEKLELEREERDEIKKDLEKQGVKFDSNGDISNYAIITEKALSDLNKEIAKYNAMTAEQQQKYEGTVQAARKRYDALLENIDRYDDIVSNEIPELQKQIRNIRDQVIEKQIQKFKIKVDLQLDLSQAERDFNEFRKKVINKIKDDDILGNTKALLKDFSSYYKKGGKGVITGLTNQVNDTLEQLYSIDQTGTSSVYGDNRAAALKDLQEYTNKLMENLEDVEDLVDDIKESIFDAIDKAQDAFDEQVNEYQFISKIIDHDVKMVKLLYGDDAYESMNKYHSQQQENNNKQLDFLKRQKDYWAGQMAAEQARMNNLDPGTAAFKEAQKRFEEYKKHWMSSVEDLNSKLEDSLENVIDKYANAIDLTFDKLNKKLTDGKGLEYVNEEWQLINKKSDMYLDKINSMYEIDKLENAYQDLLKDNEGNLAAQRSIKDMMKEQIAYLKDKDKLTQYDVDRANALLQIEVKRLALEQQRQSKTKLRLRRDSQGNYTYQYTADQESLDNAEQELRDAENSLYNMTRQAYKNNLKDFYDTYSDWQDRIKEVAKDTTLTVEEQQQKMAMLNQYYGDMINGYVEENANLQKFLMQDAFDELSTMYGTDVTNYESMIQEEKQALMGDLVPQWDSSVQDMINIFAGEKDGKKGFLPTVQEAFTGIDTATEQYEASLDTLQQVAGVSFQDIANGMDATSVEAQKLLDDNITLINAYGAEVNAVQGVIDRVREMQTAYSIAEGSAIAAAQAASKYIQKEGDLNKTAAAAQAAKTALEAAAAARANSNNYTPTNSNPSSNNSGGGNTGGGNTGGGNTSPSSNSNFKPKTGGNTVYGGPNAGQVVDWWIDQNGVRHYATGGYTGAWGNEGKIAVLHEKELVLNKEDTANMLQAVSIVRTMNDLLSNINSSTDFINTIGFGSGNNSQTLEQNVHIEASFPNVTDHFEIEQALNNLVNRASQFAFKN